MALVFVLVSASFLMLGATMAPRASAAPPSVTPATSSISSINYTYSDFFNVPYGEWWDMRSNAGYGDEPVGASCFNQTSVNDGTCTTNIGGISRVAHYPYEDWLGPAGTAAIYAPYRVNVKAVGVGGYNLSQPVFLPVLNYGATAGSTLNFNWNMQYLDKANFTLVTTTRGCYGGTGANADEGYQLWSKIYLTLDNQEAARLFGATVSATPSTIQNWWNTNTLAGCSGSKSQSGPLETSLNNWYANTANNKYAIYNGYAGAYISLYTNVTATVVSGGATGLTHVYIEHGAWGTEALMDRLFYWGNATYAGNQLDSGKAAGWWGMENGWWEGVHYAGTMNSAAMAFNLTGVLQYHFQQRSLPGPDNVFRSSTNLADADDVPVWTWGPFLLDYVASTNPNPYSELSRFTGLNYIKTTPGSSDYGTNTSFDYTPISWAARTGESWYFIFPTSSAAYYANPATATLGTTLPATQLPAITSTLSLEKLFPAGYGTWNAAAGTWSVTGGTPPAWPASTGPGTYPYIPYPGIYLQPNNLPPTVTTTAATGITTTAATLNGNLGSLGSAYTVSDGFLWGTSATLVGATNVTVSSSAATGAFSHALSSLTPSTTYYFETWANGASFVHGSILSFTTATPASPPTVTTVAASGITTSAGTLNGDLTGLGSATTVNVGFLWGTSPTLVGATNVTVGPMTATGAFSHGLTGLASGTTYYFEAWANGAGFATGTILSFTTATVGAAPSVTTDAATAITTTAATLNGVTTSLGTAATITVGFLWGTSATLSGATNVTVGTQTATAAFSSPLSSLSPGVTYYFEAWANGNGFANGAILSFTTATTPPTVSTVAASGVTTTDATLNGDLTSLGTATSVDVGFLYDTSATLAGATNVTVGPRAATGPFPHALTGLSPGVTYYFEAWANGQGFAHGTIMNFTMAVLPPVVVTDPAGGIATTNAILYGHTTSLGTATSVEVGFLYGTSAALTGATNLSVTTQTVAGAYIGTIGGLTPGTTYYFQAWANGQGFATGTILNFMTTVLPPVVLTNAATGISPTTATLNGATTDLGTATSVDVGFLWGTSATLVGATNVTVTTQTAIGAFSDALSGLTLGTTYYFQAWANGEGFATGTILSFTASLTPPSVTSAAASGITTSAATLNGNLGSLGSASSVTVGFRWGASPILAGATNVTVGPMTATGAFSHGLTGLTPSTTYYFEAWASGDAFAVGTILNFATSAPAAPPTVTSVAASGVAATAATLNGNLASLGSASSVTVGFLWGTSSSLSGATNATVGPETATGAFTDALTGLTAGTTYFFRAWANGQGFAQGAILSFATSTAVTSPSVSTVDASGVTTTTASLNGNLAGLGSASTVTAGFLWGTSADLSGATNVTVGSESGTGAFTYALTGLSPGTTYYFEAWVLGSGFVHGTILSFTTPAETPPPATFLGLPALAGYAVVAVIVIILAALVVVLLMRRRRKSPPENRSPPENP